MCAGIGEKPPRLFLHAGARRKIAPRGGGEQLGIRHRVPERVGEPAGSGPCLQLRVRRGIQAEQKIRRLQHRLHDDLRALQKIGVALHERFIFHESFIASLLTCIQRTAKSLHAELADKAGAAGGGWLARDEPMRVSPRNADFARRSTAEL